MKPASFILVGAAFLAMIFYAPKYLSYADKPIKSDVIILIVGPDLRARKNEALKLIEQGYAKKLLVTGHGNISNVPTNPRMNVPEKLPDYESIQSDINDTSHYPWYFENTHKEMLEAKKAIDRKGFRSAIFVSSPFHMRRIKIIADHIFDSRSLQMKFVPTRYESGADPVWFLSRNSLKMVALEYFKVVWFVTYRHFVSQSRLEQGDSISIATLRPHSQQQPPACPYRLGSPAR